LVFDVPPPGGAFTTFTEAVLGVAMSAAEMEAVSVVLLENVVFCSNTNTYFNAN
jgi:hypothetical protein